MLSLLCPLMMTDLSSKLMNEVFATDASDAKGAVVSAQVEEDVARALWRSGRKKGGQSRLLSREAALVRKVDPMAEPRDFSAEAEISNVPAKTLAQRFHFIEICGGAGKVSKFVAELGWVVGPLIDLDKSPHFDWANVRVLEWVYHLLEQGLLDAFMVEPPCTTFSPAQYPASRSYQQPRGFQPDEPKTLLGTTLALRSLAAVEKGSQVGAPFLAGAA